MASELQLSHVNEQSWAEQHTATLCSSGRSESERPKSVSKVDETASVDEHHDPPVESVDDGQVDGVKTNSDQEHLSNEQEVSNTEGEGANEKSDLGRQKVEVVGGSVDSIYLDTGDSHAKHNQETQRQRRPTKVCYAT